MKRLIATIMTAATVLVLPAATGETQTCERDDFAGMDTTSVEAVSFWDVSGHATLTNTVVSAAIAAGDTVDTRRVGSGSATIDNFDSRFFTVEEFLMTETLRTDPPKGGFLIVR